MGRKSLTRELAVWVNGEHAAIWRFPPRGPSELQYISSWIQFPEGRPLSLSLPFSMDNAPIKGSAVDNYFENLLPDSDAIRQRIRDKFNTPSRSAFDLLAAIGRDCVGATQLLPSDEQPTNVQTIDANPVSNKDIERLLVSTTSSTPMRSLGGGDLRISIAGAQEKTALLRDKGQWCVPHGSTPTTHIFKLPLGLVGGLRADMTTSLENEWLCSRILRAFELPVADCEIGTFGDQRALIVERFDRQLHSSRKYWLRRVQEDFCQAAGIPPSQKYESDGGPGILEIARILRGSDERDADLKSFLKAQIVFWLLAAGDGHAKNFSIRILAGGRYRLTPLYDVISYFPIMGRGANRLSTHDLKMAMAFRGKSKHYAFKNIQRRHMNATVARSGYGENAEPLIEEILNNISQVVETVENEILPGFPENVADDIFNGMKASAKRLQAMPS